MRSKKLSDPKVFSDPERQKIHDTLMLTRDALTEKGYNPQSQMGLYLVTEDESYITMYNNARKALSELDRTDVLNHLLTYYFEN